jgi:hypothetical protein
MWKKVVLFVFIIVPLGVGCVRYPPKTISLQAADGVVYFGELEYVDGYSGILTIERGPEGASYSGRFVVVDFTAKSTQSGGVVVPVPGSVPAVGSTSATSSGEVNAFGSWHAVGSNGASMSCELRMGRGGHGVGTCKHSNGREYKISL